MVYRRESLEKRLAKLREYHRDLEEYGDLSFEEYIDDRKNRYAIERILFLITENILDFLDHILSSKYQTISEGYENILENAAQRKIITPELFESLRGMGGFRNILAHEYLGIDNREVYRNLHKMLDILEDVINHMNSTI